MSVNKAHLRISLLRPANGLICKLCLTVGLLGHTCLSFKNIISNFAVNSSVVRAEALCCKSCRIQVMAVPDYAPSSPSHQAHVKQIN